MTRRPLLLVLSLVMFVAACSSSNDDTDSSSDDGIATLDDGGAASGDDALAAAPETTVAEEVTFEEAQLDFADCMREEYPEWPDPDPNVQGGRAGFDRDAIAALGIDFQSQEFRELLGDCQQESFNGVAGTAADRSPEEQAEFEDNTLALFACVREVPGFEDLPDPDFTNGQNGFGLRDLFLSGELNLEDFRAAATDCATELGIDTAGGGGGGGGLGGGRPAGGDR